ALALCPSRTPSQLVRGESSVSLEATRCTESLFHHCSERNERVLRSSAQRYPAAASVGATVSRGFRMVCGEFRYQDGTSAPMAKATTTVVVRTSHSGRMRSWGMVEWSREWTHRGPGTTATNM